MNKTIFEKSISVLASVAIMVVMLLSLPAVEVHANSLVNEGEFEMNGVGISNTDYSYSESGDVQTLTVTGGSIARVFFDTSGGKTGHVIVAASSNGMQHIDTNGNVTVYSDVSGNIVTDGDVLIDVNGNCGTINAKGDVTVNGTASTVTTEGVLTLGPSVSIDDITIDATSVNIDGTNIVVENAGGTSTIPLANVSGTLEFKTNNITISGNVPNDIVIDNDTANPLTVNIQAGAVLPSLVYIYGADQPATVDIAPGAQVNGGMKVGIDNNNIMTIRGDVKGGITTNANVRSGTIMYESGTLTGGITNNLTGVDVAIGAAATVNGHVLSPSNVTVSGRVNGNVTSTGGTVNLTVPGGAVTGAMSPAPASGVVFVSSSTGLNTTLGYSSYYPVSTGILGTPQQAAPATGGYMRITYDGGKDILELNNADLTAGMIINNSVGVPFDIGLIGVNTVGYINSGVNTTTITAAPNGYLSAQLAARVLTLESGYINAVQNPRNTHPIVSTNIVINGGELIATGIPEAISVKPTINTPSGMVARVIAGADSTTAAEVAQSTGYHTNSYVHISFASMPTTNTATTTTTYNPAISPQTGVYTS